MTPPTAISTLSLHDALPIFQIQRWLSALRRGTPPSPRPHLRARRSEEHTSELQSQFHLVCRLLLEKKNGAMEAHMVAVEGADEGVHLVRHLEVECLVLQQVA